MIHIVIIEPKEKPIKDEEIQIISKNIASELYNLIDYKENFDEVIVEFNFWEMNTGSIDRKVNFSFKSSDLNMISED